DGFAILEALRSMPAALFLPIVVLTADANEQTKRRALSAGATDFLLKPFDELEVLLRIGNMLETRLLHRRLDTQRAALEEALRDRSLELRDAQSLHRG
ncbi:MAG TPA: response regulator, partial [Chthoniobacterales bacterium]|nr:response regulator [Chthoniobacterales bacterium]